MSILAVVWGVIEPLWAIIQLTLHIGSKNYLKVPRDKIEQIVSEAFDDFTDYIKSFGLKMVDFAPQSKDIYVSSTISRLRYSDNSCSYIDGQIEYFLSQRFSLPEKYRFDKFLLNSYLLIRLKRYRKYSFPMERFKTLVSKKSKTVFHYLAISNWSSKKANVLFDEIPKIKKPISIWTEDYKFADLWKFAQKNENSSIKIVLDDVLTSGKISQTAVLNMASTERLLIVYKYYEGYSAVREKQMQELKRLNDLIKRYSGRTSTISKNRLEDVQNQKQELLENWIRVPVGSILEAKGFKHLFSSKDPIYFIPISILPDEYHNKPKKYIDEVVLPEAKQLLEVSKESPFLDGFQGGLKYLIVAHTVQVNELTILESERTLGSLTKTVRESLLTSTLDKDGSYINNLFINDVVRNVNFLQYLRPGKTTDYLKQHFQILKSILYNKFNIDIYKPTQLIQLTDQRVEEVVDELLLNDNSAKRHLLVKVINEKVEFYRKLDAELRELKIAN